VHIRLTGSRFCSGGNSGTQGTVYKMGSGGPYGEVDVAEWNVHWFSDFAVWRHCIRCGLLTDFTTTVTNATTKSLNVIDTGGNKSSQPYTGYSQRSLLLSSGTVLVHSNQRTQNYYYLRIQDGNVFSHLTAWVSRSLTSHSTLYKSFRGRFLQVRWPNKQCQITEESQSATEIGFSPTRTTPLCYNMN